MLSFEQSVHTAAKNALFKGVVNQISYNSWFAYLIPVGLDGNIAFIALDNKFLVDTLEKNYTNILNKELSIVLDKQVNIKFISRDNPEDVKIIEKFKHKEDNEKRMESPFAFSVTHTFDNFIVGSSNQMAFKASLSIAKNLVVKEYNPFLIYGKSGLGKTHLLFSIQNEILKNFPYKKVVYIKSEQFINEFIDSIGKEKISHFHSRYRTADVLLIDDIQFIGGKERTQEEFFHTFNTLHEQGKQIVLTSDRPPKDIKTLDERLRTRFECGLLADISSPDFETRVAIILKKADSLGITIPNDIVTYIAEKLSTSVRHLEGTVNKLKASMDLSNSNPSIELAQKAIGEILSSNKPPSFTMDTIIKEVSSIYNVSPEDITSKKRSGNISVARQVAIYAAREILQLPLTVLGEKFGGRDHSTMIYAINQIERVMSEDVLFKNLMEDIIENIRSNQD